MWKDDTYVGPIPFDVVPEDVQAIVYNDSAYRDYLLARRCYELRMSDDENLHARNLVRSERVCEEDLILLYWTRIRNRVRQPLPRPPRQPAQLRAQRQDIRNRARERDRT